MWAYADPNLLYCDEGLNLWAYNVVTGEYMLVKDFSNTFPPGHLCQLSKDSHDDVFAGSLQAPKWNRTGYFVWRRVTAAVEFGVSRTTDLFLSPIGTARAQTSAGTVDL